MGWIDRRICPQYRLIYEHLHFSEEIRNCFFFLLLINYRMQIYKNLNVYSKSDAVVPVKNEKVDHAYTNILAYQILIF